MTEPIAVLGAGPLAQATLRAVLVRGLPVRLIHRKGDFKPPTHVEVRAGDLLDSAATGRALAGCRAAIMCAQPVYHRWPQEFPPLIDAVIQACRVAGCTLVMGDNLYVYADKASPLTEDTPWTASTRKGRARIEVDRRLIAAHESGRVPVAIGRGSDFFGPGVLDSTVGRMLFEPLVRGGKASGLGRLDAPHSYTYIEDFGAALAELAVTPAAWGEAWHVPTAPAVSTRRFIELAFAAAGHPPRIGSIGRSMMAVAGLFSRGARETVEMMGHFEQPHVLVDAKWRSRMQARATPLEQSLAATVRWFAARAAGHGVAGVGPEPA